MQQCQFNAVGIPIRGMSLPSLATDGRLAATVLADGQIRISTIDLASGPPVQVQDVASAAIVSRSTLAVTSGLLYARAFTALVNRATGQVTSLERFSHATKMTCSGRLRLAEAGRADPPSPKGTSPAQAHHVGVSTNWSRSMRRSLMPIVGGMDIHRKQITFDGTVALDGCVIMAP
jgi:hypothetical protein